MSEVTIDLVDRLVGLAPGLEPIFREHLSDNFGEVLPHVFFGDLTRYVVREFLLVDDRKTRHGRHRLGELNIILDELEEALSIGPGEVSELIAVSFLANLPRRGEEGAGIREVLGPTLKRELARMG